MGMREHTQSENPIRHGRRGLLLAALPGLVWAGAQAWTLGGTPGLAAFWFFLWVGVQLLAEPCTARPRYPLAATILPLLIFLFPAGAAWLLILPGPLAAGGVEGIQLFAYGWLVLAVWFFFLERWWNGPPVAAGFTPARQGALRLLIAASLLQSGALWAALYFERAWAERTAWLFLVALGVLLWELLLRWGTRFYQAPAGRSPLPFLWQSWLLRALGGTSGGARSTLTAWLQRFEDITGVRLEEARLPRQVGRRLFPVLAAAVVLAWLSTALTIVPAGHQGVRETLGRFAETALPPGPHWSLPAPLGRIHPVETGLIRALSVGFARDLQVPVLWNEKHLEGEENFLVGDGDEMLTVNVPILWRVADAPLFLTSVQDPAAALTALAQQQLLRALQGRELFALMSTERAGVAEEIRRGLETASEALGMGVEVVFVGLQDIHPPVQVAEAYQAVAAAEEEQRAMVERAIAYRVERTLEAQMEAFLVRTRAETAARQQILMTESRTALLSALAEPAAAEREGLFFRLREETWERALAGREKIILPGPSAESLLFDLRSTEPPTSP
jgi:membrane protease subunit HflK